MWGFNFTAIRYGLDEYQPFTFAAWRFALAALPVLFVPKPAVSWTTLAGIAIILFALILTARLDRRQPPRGATADETNI